MSATHFRAIHTAGPAGTVRYLVYRDQQQLSFGEVIDLWQNNHAFREFFNGLLLACPYVAFRWEAPPVSKSRLAKPFEFVLIDAPELEVEANGSAFEEHFRNADDNNIVVFSNLSGDAALVVPAPYVDDDQYEHLAAFLRHAPNIQQHAFWRTVGKTVDESITDKPLWLSTAGAGVPWLHARLDSRPKYYQHRPYR